MVMENKTPHVTPNTDSNLSSGLTSGPLEEQHGPECHQQLQTESTLNKNHYIMSENDFNHHSNLKKEY